MEGENAPPLGIVIAFWIILTGGIAVACAPVILALLVAFGGVLK